MRKKEWGKEMKKRKKRIRMWGVLTLCCLILTGCGKKKPEDMPEDTPWNHGYQAIMETETGYYTNRSSYFFDKDDASLGYSSSESYGNCLQYWEKETGVSILLCNKPECQHNGDDSCEATYRYIRTVNTALYDGSLYILGMDYEGDLVSLNLYRGALDGSSMDKVGTVIQAENLKGENIYRPSTEDGFILHKGYAYIPYYLRFGQASKTFMGGGLMKMNLLTGETQELYTMKNLVSGFPSVEAAIGDYVYFLVYERTGNFPDKTYRYVISEDRVEQVTGIFPVDPENASPICCVAFSEDRNYTAGLTVDEETEQYIPILIAYDSKTGQLCESDNIRLDIPYESEYRVVCYEDKLMITTREKVVWYSKKGEKLTELAVPFEGNGQDSFWDDEFLFRISQGNLYLLYRTTPVHSLGREYDVYACGLEELFAGKGEWKKVFEINNQSLTGM